MEWCLTCHRDPTPYLRPREDVFSTSWHPDADQAKKGHALLERYGIATAHLTECSVCHR